MLDDSRRRRRILGALTVVALIYSSVHFLYSGVIIPLREPNLGTFEEETTPLREHLATGQPVHVNGAVRYGGVFYFVMHPLLSAAPSEEQLAHRLYAIQIICLVAAFAFTWATLRPFITSRDRPLMIGWLLVVWLNFAPLNSVIALKTVETWELALIAVALYALLREKTWITAFALASAALIKVLPGIFFYYLLLTHRRAFLKACVALVLLLIVSHAVYGPEVGLWYLPTVARSSAGASWGVAWHSNFAVKAAIMKMVGHLDPTLTGGLKYYVITTPARATVAIWLGDFVVLSGAVFLTWCCLRGSARSRDTIVWEWSMFAVAVLILSPNTTLEYGTLALGALSYAIVRVDSPISAVRTYQLCLGGAMFLLGVLLPRQVLNRLTFAESLSRANGYSFFTPSEAYQYYCFPLVGLLLLVAAIWTQRPSVGSPAPAPAHAPVA